MKIKIDENNYLTGDYCKVGNIDNAIDMDALPDDSPVYYTAWKILSKQEDKMTIVYEPVEKERMVEYPILDEEGNDTGEVETRPEKYTEYEPVEKPVSVTVYYYELDETKRQTIEDSINNPAPIPEPIDYDAMQLQLKKQAADIDFIALLTGIDL